MDSQEEALDKQDNKSSKSKKKDSPGNKKSSGFAKLASKVTRKRSLKKEKKEKLYDPVFSSTEDSSSNSISDLPISPADSGLSSCSSPPMSGPTLVPLSKSTSKSEDSLDSGIYSRQKSCDSVDSLGSTGSSGNGTDNTRTVMSYVTAGDTVPATDEFEHHSQIYAGKYDDYWREYQDIRQSIIVHDDDFDKRSVTRTDSGGDEEEDEGEWLRQAGLSDLVSSGGLTVGTQSDNASNASARLSTDSLTSMTILSTLTRPQREAVLRRITSFNRAQKSRRRPKPHINAVFSQSVEDGKNSQDGTCGKPPLAPPTVEVTLPSDGPNNDEKASKSTSLPHNISGFGDYPRRYSEVTRRPATSAINLTDSDGLFSSSLTSAFSTPSLDTGHVVKLDQKGYQRKEALNSIVATESTAHSSHDAALSSSSHDKSASFSHSGNLFRRRCNSFPAHCSDTASDTDESVASSTITPELHCPHFTFPPRHTSPKNKTVLRQLSSGISAESIPTSKPPYAFPIKSFLHGSTVSHNPSHRITSRPVSKQFTSDLSPGAKSKIEPFEFSPITLTTSMTSIRNTRVIHSVPSSPILSAKYGLRQRSDLTTSTFSKQSGPIPSILPTPGMLSTDSDGVAKMKDLSIANNAESDSFLSTTLRSRENSDSLNSVSSLVSSESEHASDSSLISFTSSLNYLADQKYNTISKDTRHTLPLRPHHRRSSLRQRRTKSTNLSPRRKSVKSIQTLLPKVTSFSITNLTTSPTRMGTYKLRQHSPKSRKLKRSSSLYGEPAHPHHSTLESDINYKSSGIETLSIQSRSTEDTSWRDNFTEDNNNKNKQPMGYSETADQENLPNFSLVKDRLGITRLSDLSLADVKKVQSLAYIELTALFDLHNIELKRRKFGKVKTKETGLFGIPLTTLLEWDQKRLSDSELKVPLVLRETIMFLAKNGLNDEGILRVPGSAVRIKNLRQELESKFSQLSPTVLLDPNAGWNEARTNDVAALLKQFLRELPNPLLTYEYIDAFQSCVLIPDRKQQLQALNLLIILLNDVHRDSLKILLQFLSKVVAKEEVNKMTLNNVAMIMAPNLFMAKKQSKRAEVTSAQSASEDVKHAAGTSNIVRMLIKYHKLLWTVPTFMLTQVRNMNQAEQGSKKHHHQPKEKMKIKFPGMSKTKDPQMKLAKSPLTHEQFDYEVPKGVIRVKVENHSMTSMAVQLDAKSTAGDVIAKFQKQCERAKQMSPDSQITVITNETHALYEVGGNIFERCLDPGTNMHALTKINPDATWIIKKRSNS